MMGGVRVKIFELKKRKRDVSDLMLLLLLLAVL